MVPDSTIDRIVARHFSAISTVEFNYRGKTYQPKPLRVSPLLFRNLDCKASCGACCVRVTLDYLPFEIRTGYETERQVEFNGHQFTVFSDLQNDHNSRTCRHLNQTSGRCGIHGQHPYSCDFEIIRAFIHADETPNRLSTQAIGRAWNLQRIDGGRGALCGIYEDFDPAKSEVIRKLRRLQSWADYFELPNRLPAIIEWAELQHEMPSAIKMFN